MIIIVVNSISLEENFQSLYTTKALCSESDCSYHIWRDEHENLYKMDLL